MIEDTWGCCVPTGGDVDACLFVEPPLWEPQLGGHDLGLFEDDAMRLEDGVDVSSGASGVIRQGHRGAPEDVDIRHNPSSSQTFAQVSECELDGPPIE